MGTNIVETELVETEEIYVHQLEVLITSFLEPLEQYVALIKSSRDSFSTSSHNSLQFVLEQIIFDERIDIIEVLFTNIKAIHSCNSMLLTSMQSSATSSSPNSQRVVASLLKHLPFLKIYVQYASSFDDSNALLTRLEEDVRVQAFLHCASCQPQCRGLSLRSLLIMPIQRTPRYELLLKEMLKQCKSSHDPTEEHFLQQAVASVQAVVSGINNSITQQDRGRELASLSSSFDWSPLIAEENPGRVLVRNGEMKKLCRTGLRTFFFVLCSDILFYGAESSGTRLGRRFSFHRSILLADMQLILHPPATPAPHSEDSSCSFILRGPEKVFEVVAQNEAECSAWVEDIIRMKVQSNSSLPIIGHRPFYTRNMVFGLSQRVSAGVRFRQFSVQPNVDLEPGVLFFADLVDESAVTIRPAKEDVRSSSQGGNDTQKGVRSSHLQSTPPGNMSDDNVWDRVDQLLHPTQHNPLPDSNGESGGEVDFLS